MDQNLDLNHRNQYTNAFMIYVVTLILLDYLSLALNGKIGVI